MRFGRMPKTEREKLMADKEELEENSSTRILELRVLTDSIKQVYNQNLMDVLLMKKNGDDQQEVIMRINMKIKKSGVNIRLQSDHEKQGIYKSRGLCKAFNKDGMPILVKCSKSGP